MRILFVSEFAGRGSGYTTIADGLLGEWDRRGDDVVMLAFDYRGIEHQHRAAIIPSDPRLIRQQAETIVKHWKPDVVTVAFDIPLHYSMRGLQKLGVPYVGIFPVEADPVQHPSDWTLCIDMMDVSLCESRFGTQALQDAGLRTEYIPIGVDSFFYPPTPDERESARRRWNLEDRFVVYTVADNNERKNLPACLAAFAMATGREVEWPALSGQHPHPEIAASDVIPNGYYIINTKKRTVSYSLRALTERFGIADDVLVLEHEHEGGLDREALRDLYWAADVFLLLSKAEGLGLPVLEAMACELLVIGSDHTGIRENIGNNERGFLVPSEYAHIDPFGNQYRRWANPVVAANLLQHIATRARLLDGDAVEDRPNPVGTPISAMQENGITYVNTLTWEQTADVFEREVNRVINPSGPPPSDEEEREADREARP